MEGVKQKEGSKYLLKRLNNEAVSSIDTNYTAGPTETPPLPHPPTPSPRHTLLSEFIFYTLEFPPD